MTIKDLAKKIFLLEIMKGMALTLRMMFTRPITRQYPKEKRDPVPGFRGLHALVRKEDGNAKCVGCGLCAAVCPSKCISVYTSEASDHTKVVDRYEIEVLRCVYCAFCVEACPYGAVALTEHFAYCDYSREPLFMDKDKLLSNWDKFMSGDKGRDYFKKFWRPMSEDFAAHADQAVFRGVKTPARPSTGEPPKEAVIGVNNAA